QRVRIDIVGIERTCGQIAEHYRVEGSKTIINMPALKHVRDIAEQRSIAEIGLSPMIRIPQNRSRVAKELPQIPPRDRTAAKSRTLNPKRAHLLNAKPPPISADCPIPLDAAAGIRQSDNQ